MLASYFQTLSAKHSCGTPMETREVPVDGRVLSLSPYPVNYCPQCDVYTFADSESPHSKTIGDKVTEAQKQSNMRSHNSPFNVEHLAQQKE